MEIQAIYKDGEVHLQTHVVNNQCAYTEHPDTGEPFTINEYLDELGPGFVCIPLEEALERIRLAEDEHYINPWVEISHDRWDEMLNVLPPMRWRTVAGVNFFQMSELLTGDITATFARVQDFESIPGNDKYFEANRRTADKYEELAEEIKAI